MRVVVDLTRLNGSYGYGVETFSEGFVLGLCKSLPDRLIEVVVTPTSDVWASKILAGRVTNYRIVTCKPYLSFILDRFLALVYHSLLPMKLHSKIQNLKWKKLKTSYEDALVFIPSTYLNVTFGKNTVVCLHDCQEKVFPRYFTSDILNYREINLQETLKMSSVIQFSSLFTQNEFERFFHKKLGKNFVVSEGVDTGAFVVPSREESNNLLTILVPGSYSPHKGHMKIVQAILQTDRDLPLRVIFTGKMNSLGQEIANAINQSGEKRIELLGYIDRDNFYDFYSRADVVLSASEYESSSLPLLEGYCARCILLASSIPAHLEMADTIPINFFNAQNPIELASILTHLCHEKINKSLKYPAVDTIVLREIDWQMRAKQSFENSVEILGLQSILMP
jgi:glycosyltransferase involved in cell wall biosynthesis